MREENMRFGRFIKTKRLSDERELTLKDLSDKLGLSLSMLSDIENGRRRPFDSDKIEVFCAFLNLTPEDKALMYDLAAREKSEIPSDFEDTLMYSESGKIMRRAIRMTNEGLADEEDWRDFIRRLEKKKKET